MACMGYSLGWWGRGCALLAFVKDESDVEILILGQYGALAGASLKWVKLLLQAPPPARLK